MSNKPNNITIVVADYHRDLADHMIHAAKQELLKLNVETIATIRVPGSYEIPLAVKHAIDSGKTDAIVVLAYIERGQTLHGEVMGHVVHSALINLQTEYNMPMGLGIIGPGATKRQAEDRKTATAQNAARAAIRSYQTINDIITE